MTRRGLASAMALAPVGVFAGALAAQGAPVAGERSCVVCHAAAARAVALSPHGGLLTRADTAPRSCTVCHGDLSAHVARQARPTEGDREVVPPVAATACASCHAGRDLTVAAGTHPAVALRSESPRPPEASAAVVRALEQREHDGGFDWSGLVEFGYRFVRVTGSQARFDTDVDLQDGLRLHNAALRGVGGGDAFASELSLDAHDIGDPRWDVGAHARKDDVYGLGATYRRDRFLYRADGDYHRVDRETGVADYDAEVWLTHDLRLFGSFERASEEGFWLTQRIGNRNVGVQSFVDGVESPRRYDSNSSTVGLAGSVDDWKWSAAVDYLGDHGTDHWQYSRPAPANPAFPESEDFTSHTTLHGPGARVGVSRDFGDVSFDVTGRWVGRDRSLAANGVANGYDVAQFTTTTDASGEGSMRAWIVDGSGTVAMTRAARIVVDLHWRDYAEDFLLRQTDVTQFPTLGTSTTVLTNEDQHTAQRLFDGGFELQVDATSDLTLSAGWGFAVEQLRVPDLDPADNDFRAGTVRDNGVLLGLDWRFAEHWRLRGDLRNFGQDGVMLHELAPEYAQTTGGTLAYTGEVVHSSTFVRYRHIANDVSRHHLENLTTGLHAGVTRDGLSLDADYTFARTDTATLTNFYFDPDPNPQPTFVGYRGDTHTVIGTLGVEPSAGVHWEVAAAWTDTYGSFDLGTTDWRAGLRCDVAAGGAAGIEYRGVRYREEQGIDNFDAHMVWLYWRQTF